LERHSDIKIVTPLFHYLKDTRKTWIIFTKALIKRKEKLMKCLGKDDPRLATLVTLEKKRLQETLNLIAAENHAPYSVMEVMGSVLNTKTIEGYPGQRFHSGCAHVDEIENLAIDRARALFDAEYVNVQPHSGTSANLAVYFSVLKPGDRVLAMSLPHGGHLSHGHRASITSQCFEFAHYGVDPLTERLDNDQVRETALKFKPRMIVAGASSYPRLIDYPRMAAIAREVSAYLMVDMAHLAGLVAGGVIPSPVPHADFTTFTCYKTMMGGRGGVILARKAYASRLDRAVFPGAQGTSAVNLIAAKALIFKLALEPAFARIQQKTLALAALMADCLTDRGYRLVTGGTDNHQVLVDLSDTRVSGQVAEKGLEAAGIVLNRNVVPKDAQTPGRVSGIRIGTGAVAARGMGQTEIRQIAEWIHQILEQPQNRVLCDTVRRSVKEMCGRFPVYESAQ
jgi:glycine hydroxymethyltransferase